MLTVYELEDGDIAVIDGEINEKNMHLDDILGGGVYKKTVYDEGVIIIRSNMKIEKL